VKSYEAIRKAVQGDAVDHAKSLGLHTRTIYKWTEPTVDFSDSGALNPLDRIETIITTAIRLSQPVENAQAPIFYLAARFGGAYIPSLPSNDSFRDLQQHVFHAVEDFGSLIQSVGSALEPSSELGSRISPNERKEITLKGLDLLQAVAALMRSVEMAAAMEAADR
jgi:hypothetical protein